MERPPSLHTLMTEQYLFLPCYIFFLRSCYFASFGFPISLFFLGKGKSRYCRGLFSVVRFGEPLWVLANGKFFFSFFWCIFLLSFCIDRTECCSLAIWNIACDLVCNFPCLLLLKFPLYSLLSFPDLSWSHFPFFLLLILYRLTNFPFFSYPICLHYLSFLPLALFIFFPSLSLLFPFLYFFWYRLWIRPLLFY